MMTATIPQTNGASVTQRARVLLATKFPPKYIEDTIVPGLHEIGVDVARVVDTSFDGKIPDVDAVLFMFQYCGHDEYKVFKSRTKAAGVRFITLTRQSSEWVAALRLAGVKLPYVRTADVPAAPPPTSTPVVAPSPPPPRFRTFGAALRSVMSAEDVAPTVLADICEVSVSDVEEWCADRAAIDVDAYDKLTELFVSLMDAPSPEIARRSLPRPPPPPSPTPMPAPPSVRAPAHVIAAPAPEMVINTAPVVRTPDAPPAPPVVVAFSPSPPPAPKTERAAPAVASPLVGLLRAARALGIKDDVHACASDVGVEVKLGAETWSGATDAEAIGLARRSLDERLAALLRQVTEARQMLGLSE